MYYDTLQPAGFHAVSIPAASFITSTRIQARFRFELGFISYNIYNALKNIQRCPWPLKAMFVIQYSFIISAFIVKYARGDLLS